MIGLIHTQLLPIFLQKHCTKVILVHDIIVDTQGIVFSTTFWQHIKALANSLLVEIFMLKFCFFAMLMNEPWPIDIAQPVCMHISQ